MPDDVMLTDIELEALAEIAARLDDPWLARQLDPQRTFTEAPTPRPGRVLLGAIRVALVMLSLGVLWMAV